MPHVTRPPLPAAKPPAAAAAACLPLNPQPTQTHPSLPSRRPAPCPQEYYEVLHSCLAVAPAFADDAYYINKGSSSIGASLSAGTPLISHRYMLKSYK